MYCIISVTLELQVKFKISVLCPGDLETHPTFNCDSVHSPCSSLLTYLSTSYLFFKSHLIPSFWSFSILISNGSQKWVENFLPLLGIYSCLLLFLLCLLYDALIYERNHKAFFLKCQMNILPTKLEVFKGGRSGTWGGLWRVLGHSDEMNSRSRNMLMFMATKKTSLTGEDGLLRSSAR